MSFFQGATNITISGGSFNHNYTVFNQTRYQTNVDSNNKYNNTLRDSYNDNSKYFNDYNPPSRLRGDDHKQSTPPTSQGYRRDHSRPMPSQRPRMSTAGGHAANPGSHNARNFHMKYLCDDNCDIHYHGDVPPTRLRSRVSYKREPAYYSESEEEEDEYNNGGSLRENQVQGCFQTQHLGSGVRSDPFVRADDTQSMNRVMHQKFLTPTKQARPMVGERGVPYMPGNDDENYESDDSDSGLSHSNGTATNLPPHQAFSRIKSDSQIPVAYSYYSRHAQPGGAQQAGIYGNNSFVESPGERSKKQGVYTGIENNILQDVSNNNSLVDLSGEKQTIPRKQGVSEDNLPGEKKKGSKFLKLFSRKI